MVRLAVAIGLVVAAAGLVRAQPDAEAAKEKLAELDTRNLLQACEAYYLNPQSGNTYPKALGDLVMPPFGGAPFVKGLIFDPWKQPYRYKVVALPAGGAQPFVWSERVVNGTTKVFGKKPPEAKKE